MPQKEVWSLLPYAVQSSGVSPRLQRQRLTQEKYSFETAQLAAPDFDPGVTAVAVAGNGCFWDVIFFRDLECLHTGDLIFDGVFFEYFCQVVCCHAIIRWSLIEIRFTVWECQRADIIICESDFSSAITC